MSEAQGFRRILVVGAGGGLGAAFCALCRQRYPQARLIGWARRPETVAAGVETARVDLGDEASIAAAAEALGEAGGIDLAIVATGLLHASGDLAMRPEKSWRALDPAAMMASFQTNAIGPALVAKHVLPRLAEDRRAVFAALSARVGSISDNRLGGWHSYRASKAALNQLLRTLAIELARRKPRALCVGLHPGTVDTDLSKPFQGSVPPERLFTAESSAARLLDVIERLSPEDSGGLFDWRGDAIPF